VVISITLPSDFSVLRSPVSPLVRPCVCARLWVQISTLDQ
jgi:hypothetical protein